MNEIVFRDHDLGRLEVDAHNEVIADEPIWTLDKLELANPDATLTANATWRTLPGGVVQAAAQPDAMRSQADDVTPRRTSLNFKLDGRTAAS